MTTQNPPDPQTLWSTPYISDDSPTSWTLVKTTPKRVVVRWGASSVNDQFDREYPGLPAGALAAKSGTRDPLVLFEDRAACLRFMAARARKQADALEFRAAEKRADADRWDAEAEETSR
jgi:hypothetical protein